MSVYNWQINNLHALFASPGKLHHALLISGPSGIGKSGFAEEVANGLLCEHPLSDGFPCKKCDACRWLEGGNHPDFRKLTLEDAESDEGEGAAKSGAKNPSASASRQIRIDQVRALEDFIYIGSHRHGNRVVLIDPADALNTAATNSLLKILEEPPSSVYFLLISSKFQKLLPTLRSRCLNVPLTCPDLSAGRTWLNDQGVTEPDIHLALAGGAPLNALRRYQDGSGAVLATLFKTLDLGPVDAIGLASFWEAQLRSHPEISVLDLVDALQKWIYDLVRVTQGNMPPRYAPLWKKKEELFSINRLQKLYRDLCRIRRTAQHPLNLQLLLEDLATRCTAALNQGRN